MTEAKVPRCHQCGGQLVKVRGATIHRWKNDYNRCKTIAFAKAERAAKEREL